MVTALHSDAQVSACLDDGAVDHIRKPFSSMVVRARVRAALRSRDLAAGDKPRTPKQGRVLGFMGVKGGVGTTTIAVNVALVLCKEGREVAVAELTPYAGAIATQLGVSSSPNIEPLLRHEHPGAITSETLSRCLTNHPTGLRLLLAPPNMDEPCEMTGQQVEAIVNGLASMVDYVVLDIPSHSVMVAKAALRCCQFVAIVVEWELTSLASAPAMFKALDYWGIGGTSVGVVLIQRIPDTATMTAEYVRSHLARPLVGVIPSASDLCAQALQSGSPLVLSHPDSVCAAAFDELAERLAAEHVSAFVFH
jgi:pilus assembly protein CpaE